MRCKAFEMLKTMQEEGDASVKDGVDTLLGFAKDVNYCTFKINNKDGSIAFTSKDLIAEFESLLARNKELESITQIPFEEFIKKPDVVGEPVYYAVWPTPPLTEQEG